MSAMLRRDPIINGKTETGKASEHLVVNPYSNEPVGTVGYADQAQMACAVACAKAAFSETREQPSYERADVLERCSEGIRSRNEELSRLITAESGKPISYSRIEVDRAVFTFKSAADAARHVREGRVLDMTVAPNGANRRGEYRYFPLGVVAAVTPFNFPLNLVAHKVAPAIAAGNSIVLKPAPQTPFAAFALADILAESGLEKGALNVVPCENDIAESLVRSESIAMVSFTGSATVGWRLKGIVGKAKVTLELGGNGMVIVDEIDDLDKLIRTLNHAAFSYAGQVCIGLQNLLVRSVFFDEVLERLVQAGKETKVGDPGEDDTVVGPMISSVAARRTEAWIAEAVSQGATRHLGEYRNPNWITPSVLTDVPQGVSIWREEAFAPILNISSYRSFNDALEIVNSSSSGLQAGVFTNDRRKIQEAYDKLEVGTVIINDSNSFRLDTMPYGGIKNSGFGREGLLYAVREMSEMKLLVETV